jgi:anthranilate synthase component I
VSLQSGEVSSFPLAGTCPRGATKEEDDSLCSALLQDEKEMAEHDMLVDLARNDVGKVSRFKSVKVNEYRQIKRFSHVSHIASRITGELREGQERFRARRRNERVKLSTRRKASSAAFTEGR